MPGPWASTFPDSILRPKSSASASDGPHGRCILTSSTRSGRHSRARSGADRPGKSGFAGHLSSTAVESAISLDRPVRIGAGLPASARASLEAQRFRYLQKVNDLEISSPDGRHMRLTTRNTPSCGRSSLHFWKPTRTLSSKRCAQAGVEEAERIGFRTTSSISRPAAKRDSKATRLRPSCEGPWRRLRRSVAGEAPRDRR